MCSQTGLNVSFATNPSGLSVLINGQTFATPQDAGLVGRLQAERKRPLTPDPLWEELRLLFLVRWQRASNTQSLPGQRLATYTATFKSCTKSGTSAG